MSALYQSGSQMSMEEVVPAAAAVKGLTRSSILSQRRRIRIQAQGGRDYGSFNGTTASGGGNQQLQFLLSDAGGLVDPSSICLVYNMLTATGTAANQAVPDDSHPFTRVQISLNGQLLDDVNSAAKNTNAEVTLGATRDWYKTSGSFCGFELLNNDLNTGTASVASATALQQYSSAWGDVSGNWLNIEARYDDGTSTVNPLGGVQRVLPLGLISGVGRMKNYLPLSILGELSFTFFTGSANEVLFSPAGGSPDFCLRGVYLIADVVIPHPAYAEVLSRMANEGGEGGLNMVYESTIVSQGGVMSANAGALTDYSIVVSRATNNLVRSLVWLQPNARLTSSQYPIQSCFNHGFTNKIQWRIGSQFYPSIPAEGDADIWAMSASAYGTSGLNEQNGVANNQLWRQTTPVTQVAAHTNGEGAYKFDYADKFVPAYGFRIVKGAAEEIQMDGVSLAGASGSQAVVAITAAPAADTAPFVSLVALRVIQAANGQVRVLGA
jgi:hypothetical protein